MQIYRALVPWRGGYSDRLKPSRGTCHQYEIRAAPHRNVRIPPACGEGTEPNIRCRDMHRVTASPRNEFPVFWPVSPTIKLVDFTFVSLIRVEEVECAWKNDITAGKSLDWTRLHWASHGNKTNARKQPSQHHSQNIVACYRKACDRSSVLRTMDMELRW
jgi:hypothetical protein